MPQYNKILQYQFDSLLNKVKLFQCTPSPNIQPHITTCFRPNGYSIHEKAVAAKTLETTLKEADTNNNLLNLEKSYPALKKGRLGFLFKTFCELSAQDASVLARETPSASLSLRQG